MRYARLLEGLEISEISFQVAMNGTEASRIDPEYFSRAALDTVAMMKGELFLGDLVADGYRAVYETTHAIDRNDGLARGLPFFLQSADISTPFIDQEAMICVGKSDWNRYPRGRIIPGELLIEVKGKAEKIALVPEDFPTNILVTGTCFKLTTRDKYDQYLLAAYLTCRYGQILKNRLKTNLLISYLAKTDLYRLPVPLVSSVLKSEIRSIFEKCFSCQNESQQMMTCAETTLLHALNLSNWQAPEPLSYTRSSSDAFASGRLDAEHFQPKFQSLATHLRATGQTKNLENVLLLNQRGKQPDYTDSDSGVPVVNSKHINKGEVRIDSDNRFAHVDEKTILIQPGDVVMNGTGVGTIGRAAPYLHKFSAVPDNHVTILKPKPGMDAVYLSVFINSVAGQMQVSQRLRGSSGQIELYPNDIGRFVVWDAPGDVQTNIRQLVMQSFEAKQRATQLLDAAKRAVEIAIESSEDAALAYLAQYNPH